jgi:hypothetical protein
MKARERLSTITPERCVEWFAASNLAFLGVDIAVAHAENGFARRAEWAPIWFSVAATVLLVPMVFGRGGRFWRGVETAVGAGAILVGVLGMVFHLESGFFQRETLHDLVYSAPFVAPLAYVGVGLLLLLLRTEQAGSPHIGWWLLLLALGGFVGNFGLSLLDHAQNGFFRRVEWVPVVAAAFATSFLLITWLQPSRMLVSLTWLVLAVQVLVGVAGFALHVAADLGRSTAPLIDRFIFGAPVFAPLLFADLAVLAAIALWATARSRPQP